MGVPQPNLVAWITTILEFIGGLSIIVGAFVAPLALPLSVIMLTAMLKIHLQYGFSSVRLKSITATGAEFGPIGYEINLLYIAGLITLALSETPPFSFDYWIKRALARIRRAPLTVKTHSTCKESQEPTTTNHDINANPTCTSGDFNVDGGDGASATSD